MNADHGKEPLNAFIMNQASVMNWKKSRFRISSTESKVRLMVAYYVSLGMRNLRGLHF